MPTLLDKNSHRLAFRDRLSRLSDGEYQTFSSQISSRMMGMNELRGARTVHTFWPVVGAHEPDIRPLIEFLKAAGIRIVLPVVTDFRKERSTFSRLRHVELEDMACLKKNRWGIAEPQSGADVPADEFDIVIAPGLGADMYGYRIGHGYGFYDELLTGLNIPVLCPIFSCCLVDRLPHEDFDIPVSTIITEHGTIQPSQT